MLKVEGENRIDIESVADIIAERYKITDKTALKWFCTALQYSMVMESINEQIEYLLDQGIVKR